MYSDIADWPIPVPDKLRVDLVKRGSESFQSKDGPFQKVERQGKMSSTNNGMVLQELAKLGESSQIMDNVFSIKRDVYKRQVLYFPDFALSLTI